MKGIVCFLFLLSIYSEQVYSQSFADSPWPMFGRDPGHMHRGVPSSPATNVLKWKFKAESLIYSPSIGSDGTIYAGSYDKNVYAINSDGSLKWKYEVDSPIRESSPAIGSDGTIYIGSGGTDNNPYCYLYALNPDGTLKWKYKNDYSFLTSPVIGYDGAILIASTDSYLYSLNPDGTVNWKFKFAGITMQWPAIAEDGTVYFSSGDSYLYALKPDGSLKWRYGPDTVIGPSPSIGEDGTVFVGTQNKELAAFNPDGTQKWRLPLGGYFSIHASPAIGKNGAVYIGSEETFSLYAVNPDGKLKWKFTTGGHITRAPAIGNDGCIYASSEDNSIYAINPDGTIRWKYPIGSPTTPVIGADGTLYFGSRIGYLCALAPEKSTKVNFAPISFSVKAPHPNPFNPTTIIEFTLPVPNHVKLDIYSAAGQKVATLVDGSMSAGDHSVVFEGSKHASGLYFFRFESAGVSRSGKMLLLK